MVNKLYDSSPEPSSTSHDFDSGNRRRNSAPDSPTKKQVSLEERLAASKARLEESDSGDSSSSSGTSTPRKLSDSPKPLREREITHLKEHVQLFHLSRNLTESTKDTPLLPLKGEHANDVYMHNEVVFKPGFVAASRAQISYGLARLIGIRDVLVPAKRGKATIIHKKDQGVEYRKLVTYGGNPVLIDPQKEKPLSESEISEITDSRLLEMIFQSKNFGILNDDEQLVNYIVPHDDIHAINSKANTVSIDGKAYNIKKIRNSDEFYLVGDPSKQAYMLLYRSIPDSDEMESVLVPNNRYIFLGDYLDETTVDSIVFDEGGISFTAKKIKTDEGVTWQIEVPEDTPNVYDADSKKYYTIPTKQLDSIYSDSNGEYVWRKLLQEKHKFRVETDTDGKAKVAGTFAGMVQVKVTDIFTTPAETEFTTPVETDKKPTPLNILSNSPANIASKAEFYERIDTPSFIRAFIATILLRPQDGKIADLAESNVLFQAIHGPEEEVNPQDKEVKLRPILIDLDETMPKSNDYSWNPDYIKDGNRETHAVRCGLMGFPQARKKLSDAEMEVARKLITEINNNRDHIRKYLFSFVKKSEQKGLTFEHITACLEAIDRMVKFNADHPQNDWTLENLFFTVFPEYKEQWDMLGDQAPEHKASNVGFLSKTALKELLKRGGNAEVESNKVEKNSREIGDQRG